MHFSKGWWKPEIYEGVFVKSQHHFTVFFVQRLDTLLVLNKPSSHISDGNAAPDSHNHIFNSVIVDHHDLPRYSERDKYNAVKCGTRETAWEVYWDATATTGNCYWLSWYQVHGWEVAKGYCISHNSQLLVLDSEHERRIVSNLLRQNEKNFIASTRIIYVGMSADYDQIWYTVEGDLLDDLGYVPWAVGKPSTVYTCAGFDKFSLEYTDIDCWRHNKYYLNFMCKKRVESELLRYS
ncbi:uncharacterized protein LOC133529305 [Cydia pomonella]|uniref:uncharacterized protein LOC133529305 n=1 Tax=Cydia pomonella TaxID=82600 RepID=UPI002ADDF2A9|nr:uncharacterized protein LOC133529305 [Cydia pomonella]